VVDALILSGGSIERERFLGLDRMPERKAQIPILGRPMIEWVVRGLRTCPQVERIVVVGHPGLETADLRALEATLVPEAEEIAANLRTGLGALAGARQVLALSGDLPLLTRAAIEDLLANAPPADVVFPYVEHAEISRQFPDRVWLYSWTPDGAFTGCSAALFRPEAALASWPWVERLLKARRRSPLRLAMLIGPGPALKYLLGRLHVADVERRLSSLLHLVGRGYPSRFGELAMDVDKDSDIELVERVLEQRQHHNPIRFIRRGPEQF
jgi:molybdopterin-guanine dinucleotide biosynthesis protein A